MFQKPKSGFNTALSDLYAEKWEYGLTLGTHPLQAVYWQDLFLQGEKCVMYKAWSVLYMCTICIVQGLHIILYKVDSVYYTGCAVYI